MQLKLQSAEAEEKAGISINLVNVGLPANLLQIEATQGMIPVTSQIRKKSQMQMLRMLSNLHSQKV